MLVQLAVHIFVLVALKLFLIHYCIIFLIIILKFSIKKIYRERSYQQSGSFVAVLLVLISSCVYIL